MELKLFHEKNKHSFYGPELSSNSKRITIYFTIKKKLKEKTIIKQERPRNNEIIKLYLKCVTVQKHFLRNIKLKSFSTYYISISLKMNVITTISRSLTSTYLAIQKKCKNSLINQEQKAKK